MAKGVGLISTFRGKMGNTVMYRIKDAATKETQGLRVYQPQVSNPQSDLQLDQRVKMAAVNNWYRAVKPLIDRGFEGVDYGNLSRREYLKMALSGNYGGPYVAKGVTSPYPVTTPFSRGSLAEVGGAFVSAGSFRSSITTTSAQGSDLINVWSSSLIDAGYEAGDQVTIVAVYRANANSPIIVRWESFYIDVNDGRTILDLGWPLEGLAIDSNLGIYFDGGELLAAAIVISREGSHLRSTARMAINPDVTGFSELYAASSRSTARASYRRHAAAQSSDWPIDPGTEGESAGTFTIGDVTVTGVSVEGDITVLTTSDNGTAVPFGGSDRMAWYNRYIVGMTFASSSLTSETPDVDHIITIGSGDSELTATETAFIEYLVGLGYDVRLFFNRP